MNTLLAAARFLHFAAAMLLFGSAAFRLSLARHSRALALPQTDARLRALWTASALTAVVAGVAWLALTTATMAGNWRAAFDPAALQLTLTTTWFGANWIWRMAVGVVILIFALRGRFSRGDIVWGAALVFVAGIAATGHLGAAEGFLGGMGRVADATHLVAAAAWIGGMVTLVLALREAPERAPDIVPWFSFFATGAVVLVLISGVINALMLLPSIDALWTSDYGAVLSAKIALVTVMLGFAAVNRFALTPLLARNPQARVKLARNATVEIALGAIAIAAAALLGTLPPPAPAM